MVNNTAYTFSFNDQLDELLRTIEFDENNSFLKASDGTYIMIKQIVSFKVVGK